MPDRERYYGVGDIHGRLDLSGALIDSIERDNLQSGKACTTVVMLGDLVDRGPDSAGVLMRARMAGPMAHWNPGWQQRRYAPRIIQ
ncbi:metallophosphoesterase [Erythrobacteraceae bacterium E2-1 Yellow Sea]|nr:metallophosphoesterase [Erythrobacteraceae bacterium E2-1 Yellow Sea]